LVVGDDRSQREFVTVDAVVERGALDHDGVRVDGHVRPVVDLVLALIQEPKRPDAVKKCEWTCGTAPEQMSGFAASCAPVWSGKKSPTAPGASLPRPSLFRALTG
jgi:hypothetical protein